MNTLLSLLLLFLVASPQYNVNAQDAEGETVEGLREEAEALEEMANALDVGELVQIPALSYKDEEGMLAIPTVNLSDFTSVLALQELIGNTSCDCTSSGYSGISLSDDGTLATYGNTTVVGCGAHDMLLEEGLEDGATGCYVVGGTGCEEATASTLGDENEAFTMAAWRSCNLLSSKTFGCFTCGFGGYQSSSYYEEKISIQKQSYQSYQPPVCGYCGYKPMVPYSTGYCAGSSSAAASGGFGSSAASASSGGCGGASAAAASAGGGSSSAAASGGRKL